VNRRLALAVCGLGAAALGAACSDGRTRITRDRDAGAAVVVAPVVRQGSATTAAGVALAGVPAPSAITAEVEPNADGASATGLALGAAARGTLDGATDVDVFRVEVPAPTNLLVHLGGVADVDLVLELVDATGKVLAGSDRGPALIAEGLPNVAVGKGPVLVRVREFGKPPAKRKKGEAPPSPRMGASAPYQLGVWDLGVQALAARVTGDRERNEDLGTASDLALGEPARGYLGWGGDVDVWKLSLEALTERDALDVELTGVEGVTPTLDALDAAGKVLATRKGSKGKGLVLGGLVLVRPGAAPIAHLRVRGERSHPEATYELRTIARALADDDEREPNDDERQATALAGAAGTARARASGGDVDRFALGAEDAARQLRLGLPATADVTWRVRLVAGAATLAEQRGAVGAPLELQAPIAAGTAAMIVVEPGAPVDALTPYELTWALSPLDDMPPEIPAAPSGDAPAAAPGLP
jgi:hypothetical protein